MADAFLQFMLERLNLLIEKEIGLIWGVDKEIKKLSSLLSTIQAVLEDAEEKQIEDKALQNWLWKLKNAAYKVDDIVDECATEAALLESNRQHSNLTNKVCTSCLSPHNILFHRKIGSIIKEVRERLDEIAEERLKFHLKDGGTKRHFNVLENRQTGSIIAQSQVYGRGRDKERILECLVEKVSDFDGISVYPIVGLGGLGKTTLAQMVFNDERISSHFERRIWICVSEDFSLRRIIKAMIESATGLACEDLELDLMQRRLQDILHGIRYLLVLDDVWNEDTEKWDRLKYVLTCGSRGASIIVTTRMKKVALIMGTMHVHQLSSLNEDDCWLLFKEYAFRHKTKQSSNLEALGKKIVKKCGGVPLAVKSLGSMMSYKSEENQWVSIVESELWNLPQTETSILPALRLSYSNLSPNLRQCFSYCAIFPRDFVVKKDFLVQLWMANDFIPFTEKLDPEDIGDEICKELCCRSFLQSIGEDDCGIKGFKMHDLVYDLAQFVMQDECLNTIESSTNISERTLHYTSINNAQRSFTFPKALYKAETLRTFLVHETNWNEFSCDFSRLRSLRVFCTREVTLKKLSSSISHLKHLRYLDLSYTNVQMLPESICNLYNLQTLNLNGCIHLWKLPKHIRFLKNLRHLYLDRCDALFQMPQYIGQITCLKTLTCFVVGKKRGCHLVELKGLNLGGTLHIKQLQRVKNPLDAKEANLVGKRNLRQLLLSWENENDLESRKDAEKVLEALQPHQKLEDLIIQGYQGAQFPFWMRDNILNNLVNVELSNSHNCSQLPPLAQLPSLQTLRLYRMSQVMYIDDNSQGDGITRGFPSLQSLTIDDFLSLQSFFKDDGREVLPCLKYLYIHKCPKLTLPHLPSVEQLTVSDCNEVILGSISNLRNLTSLSVSNNDKLNYLPHGMLLNLTSLNKFYILKFSKLKSLPSELVSLSALETLHISWCDEFESFPEQGMEGLKSLKYLRLKDCRKFTSLSEGLQHLSCLENLTLNGCPELVALPVGIKYLTFLQEVRISGYLSNIRTFIHEGLCGREEVVGAPKLAVLPEALRYVPALQSLEIACYPDLASLPNWLEDLTSLQTLKIFNCPKLSSLPASIEGLKELQNLDITLCLELAKRCEKETGEDWYKIAHIPNIFIH